MRVRILDSAMIEDFFNNEFDSTEICHSLRIEIEELITPIKNEKLLDWEVCFRIIYNNVRTILIYTKNKSYVNEKYKDITIHIPIPTKDKVSWGVNQDQHVYDNENHMDSILKNFHSLDVDYALFGNRESYIRDCMRRAIEYCFYKGFTINGVKVKLNY